MQTETVSIVAGPEGWALQMGDDRRSFASGRDAETAAHALARDAQRRGRRAEILILNGGALLAGWRYGRTASPTAFFPASADPR